MPNIRCIIIRTARTNNLRDIKQYLCLAMSIKTKGEINIMSDVYVNTSVSTIWNALYANISVAVTRNGFVEVSQS